MLALHRMQLMVQAASRSVIHAGTVFIEDVGHGLLVVSHSTLAFLGLVVVAAVVFLAGRSGMHHVLESQALNWLQARHEARTAGSVDALAKISEPTAVDRATATDPRSLTKEQSAVAMWISRRYRVAPEPISRLVKEAWTVGAKSGLAPTLILAVMAVESSFNPFAQSTVGAQGLMQVMTQLHDEKYEPFGGTHAAFDPVTNLRVGARILKEYIARTGSVETGLRYYVGAANLTSDGGYAGKVLAEEGNLRMVSSGKTVSVTAPTNYVPTATAQSLNPETPGKKSFKTSSEQVALQD